MTEMEEKIARLPLWAREYIKRPQIANEPMVDECVKLRREMTVLKARAQRIDNANGALMELLGKAGQSGLNWAAVVVSTLEGYEIYRDGDKISEGE